MAFRNIGVTLSTSTVTKIYTAAAGDMEIWVNADGNDTLFIGGSSVDTGNGLRLSSSAITFHTEVRPGDELYAVTSADPGMGVNIMVRSA